MRVSINWPEQPFGRRKLRGTVFPAPGSNISFGSIAIVSGETWYSPSVIETLFPPTLKRLVKAEVFPEFADWPDFDTGIPRRPRPTSWTGPAQTVTLTNSPAIASGETWYSYHVVALFPPPRLKRRVLGEIIPEFKEWPDFDEGIRRNLHPQPWNGVLSINPGAPAIRTSETWFAPDVAGPITMQTAPAIATGETWYAPTIDAIQTISPSGPAIPTSEHWYSPTVGNAKTITPPGPAIATGEHWYSPTVTSGVQNLLAFPIPSGELWFPPTVIGPTNLIQVIVGGVDVTPYLSLEAISLDAGAGQGGTGGLSGGGGGTACHLVSQTIGRWTCNFDLMITDGSFLPQRGMSIIIQEPLGQRKLMMGCLNEVITERAMSTSNQVCYHCSGADKSSICDHRVVYATYKSGTEAMDAVRQIVSQFLNGEGITTVNVPASIDTLDADQIFNYVTVTQAFDAIATDIGAVWWVDVNGDLNWSTLTNLPAAPISLSENSRNWRNLTLNQTLTNYRNKQYVVSNLNILPGSGSGGSGGSSGSITEAFTFTSGQPGIVTGPVPGLGVIPIGVQVSRPISNVASITVNGHPQTVYDALAQPPPPPSGPNDYVWQYVSSNVTVDGTVIYQPQSVIFTNSPGAIPAGAAIIVSYNPAATNVSQSVGTALVPSGGTFGKCGSGIYEAVEQVKNVSTIDDLNALAQGILNKYDVLPDIVTFETDFPGLQVGQLLNVNLPLSGITNENFLITSVEGYAQGADMGHQSEFRWVIQGTTVQDLGNWVKWFERLLARTENPLPVLQYEEATFVLGPGGSLSGAVSPVNPYIVGRTGKLVEILAAAGIAPVNQDITITITDNGSAIGTITIPAGSTALQTFTYSGSPLYVFAKDILNVSWSYVTHSGSPTAAGAVTVKVRWAM